MHFHGVKQEVKPTLLFLSQYPLSWHAYPPGRSVVHHGLQHLCWENHCCDPLRALTHWRTLMPRVILWTVKSLCWRGYIMLWYRTVHKFIPSSTICHHLHLKFSSILAVSKSFTETAGFQVRFRFPGCFTLEIQNIKPLTVAENGCKSSLPDTIYSELRFWLSFGNNQRVSDEQQLHMHIRLVMEDTGKALKCSLFAQESSYIPLHHLHQQASFAAVLRGGHQQHELAFRCQDSWKSLTVSQQAQGTC